MVIAMSEFASEGFLKRTVELFREEFAKLSADEQKRIRKEALIYSLLDPLQIELGILKAINARKERYIWFLIHDSSASDMEIKIKEIPEENLEGYLASKAKGHDAPALFNTVLDKNVGLTIVISDQYRSFVGFGWEPWRIAKLLFSDVRERVKREQVRTIERNTQDLKKSIERVTEIELRKELLATTSKIDVALKEVKRIDDDVGRVRQLMGVSKEFQDWKLLVTDVGKLKEEHVPREVFDAKISELNTRIDAFKEIKEGYERMLAQQNEFMRQQADVMKQQSSFVTWIKYSSILVPIAVVSAPIIYALLRHFLGIP